MRYAPPGLCLNDFQIIKLDHYHLFHLQGSRTYPFDAAKLETSYGHAISRDLISWETKAPVFGVSDPPHFDDSAIWTMHIVPHDKQLWMFYTGLNQRIYFQQQIGLAYTDRTDGTGWFRYTKDPIAIADPRWYQIEEDMAWRDPFVVYDAEHQQWIMYIAAKQNRGPKETRGCIGLATSEDLIHWVVHPPILTPQKFWEMERPVVYHLNNAYYMFISISNDYRVYSFRSSNLMGPFEPLGVLTQSQNYAACIIKTPENKNMLVHTVKRRWGNIDSGAIVRGMLAQPKSLLFDEFGDPYLGWYSLIEHYLDSPNPGENTNGVIFLSIPAGSRQTIVHLRVTGELSEQKGLEVILDQDDSLLLRYIEDQKVLQKEQIKDQGFFQSLKVLLFNEYFEIYLDERLFISTMAYRHIKGRFAAWNDGSPFNFKFHPFKIF